MKISFGEAAFLALLFDASLRASALSKKNITDFVTAQSFLGNDVNPEGLSDADLIDQVETVEHEMICLRSRIKDCYGI